MSISSPSFPPHRTNLLPNLLFLQRPYRGPQVAHPLPQLLFWGHRGGAQPIPSGAIDPEGPGLAPSPPKGALILRDTVPGSAVANCSVPS